MENPSAAFTPEGIRLFRNTNRGMLGELFPREHNPRRTSTELPFDQRDSSEQESLLYNVEGIVAKLRDQVAGLRLLEKSNAARSTQHLQTSTVGARAIFMRRDNPSAVKTADLTARRAAIQTKIDGLTQELRAYQLIPGLVKAYENQTTKLYFYLKALRKENQLIAELAEHEWRLSEISSEALADSSGVVRGHLLQEEQEAVTRITEINEQLEELHQQPFYRMKQLRGYSEAYRHGRLVEVPSVKELIDTGLRFARAHKPLMLAGHLGSGKTEVVKHIARLIMLEQGVGYDPNDPNLPDDPMEIYARLEPEVFSGSSEASIYDLIGKLKLTGQEINAHNVGTLAADMERDLKKRGIDLSSSEIAKVLLNQGSVTKTQFNYGPLARALRDGKPVIIDEINFMPPEVLARINDLLTKRVGERVRLQENGDEEFVIKPGFCIFSTLNIGAQYSGTQAFNAAFGNRWIGREVDYPSVEENFDLILSPLMRKDRARLPPNFPPDQYETLARLALVTREVQELFSGQTEGQRFMKKAYGMTTETGALKKNVISTRDLMRKIVEPWQQANFRIPLDDIIAYNIIAPAGIQSRDDQKFLTEIFLRRGFFQGWKAEDFRRRGILTVDDKEIDILHAAETINEFNATDDRFREILATALDKSRDTKMMLLVGNEYAN